jgi:hypothetical protein
MLRLSFYYGHNGEIQDVHGMRHLGCSENDHRVRSVLSFLTVRLGLVSLTRHGLYGRARNGLETIFLFVMTEI